MRDHASRSEATLNQPYALKVRPATPDDADDLRNLWHEYKESLLPFNPGLEAHRGPDGRFPFSTVYPEPPGDDSCTWHVILADATACGFVIVSSASERAPSFPQPVFELDEIYVDSSHQGQGVAMAANTKLIEQLAPGTVFFFVLKGNDAGRGLVEKTIRDLTSRPPIPNEQSVAAGDELDGTYFGVVFEPEGARSVVVKFKPPSP